MKLEMGKTYRSEFSTYKIVEYDPGSKGAYDYKGEDAQQRGSVHWFKEDGTSILENFIGESRYNLMEEVA